MGFRSTAVLLFATILHHFVRLRANATPTSRAQAAYVQDYARRCSRIARAFSVGKSAQGAELWALELGVSRGEDVPKPRFKYLVRSKAVGRLPESTAEAQRVA